MFRHRQSDSDKKRAAEGTSEAGPEGGRLTQAAGTDVPAGERHDPADATGTIGTDAGNPKNVFRFDPTALVRGIVFHLTDEKIATDVSRDSVRRTVERLVVGNVCPSIERGRWADMSHRERLQWLLAESRTTHSLLFGRTAVLLPAGST